MTRYGMRQNAPDMKSAGINVGTAALVALIMDSKHRRAHAGFLAAGIGIYFLGRYMGREI